MDQIAFHRDTGSELFMDKNYEEAVAEFKKVLEISPDDEVALDYAYRSYFNMGMALFGMSEENRLREIQFPAMMIGTDGFGLATTGPLARGVPHPRNYGAFPRVLSRYVRNLQVLSLEQAVYKMTGLPAKKLRLEDRGVIRPGFAADLVVFDPAVVSDTATYDNPHQYPAGIYHVLVNGQWVIRDGSHTGARPGAVLRVGKKS